MKVIYATKEVEKHCTSVKDANKLFGGDKKLTISLLARINAFKEAETIKDIIVQPTFFFHKLTNKHGKNLEGFFAIDVKSRKEPWRIILQPLDTEEKPFDPCHIDQIAEIVKIIEIVEVSKHYE